MPRITTADRKRVYLACKGLFIGARARIKKGKVHKYLNRHREYVEPLKKEMGAETVNKIVHELLANGHFSRPSVAKAEFPELFPPFPSKDAQEVSEKGTVCPGSDMSEETSPSKDLSFPMLEADAISTTEEKIQIPEDGETSPIEEQTQTPEDDGEVETDVSDNYEEPRLVEQVTSPKSSELPFGRTKMPSLFPSAFPYKAQHLILTNAQHILEERFFDFFKKHMPSMFERRKLDCGEAAELTLWKKLLKHESVPKDALDLQGNNIAKLCYHLNSMRNTTAHRVPIQSLVLYKMLYASADLARALRDYPRAVQLQKLCREVDIKREIMELRKNGLLQVFRGHLNEIERQRELLDKKEESLKATLLKDDHEVKSIVGRLLHDSAKKIIDKGHDVGAEQPKEENKPGLFRSLGRLFGDW
ncbi:uncharacterized protein K452DRAFT_313662 [Aplosporella prunicola CBS 121167]|uniref:Uncharacterized protein n=1 Tax=Aplosporella prunicola CBS 121167 TaxID=1176127 RepID=A0A6A6AXF6_9PEZI|nr:uncharacterized protein K452DRAFT_313662 [Aplosporella prunicola CBS 121167]KAF2135863.1 hypothetical protein K452DRAFT_313662 [Aplosporella prunicola CBS 121167]